MSTPAASVARPLRVLVCEDEGLSMMQLCKVLRFGGYDVVGQAATGQEAVRLALSALPDLILMDWSLAGLMTGLEAAQTILAERFVPIMMLTAYSNPTQIQAALAVGVCGYLVKPVSGEQLLPALIACLQPCATIPTTAEAQAMSDRLPGKEAPATGQTSTL